MPFWAAQSPAIMAMRTVAWEFDAGQAGRRMRVVRAATTPLQDKEVSMSRARRLAPWTIGMAAALMAAPCQAQGNIDAGKSPAQIFADTCAVCHRNAREFRRPSAAFLRQHYTSGYEEASAMASYLSGFQSEPRTAQPKRSPVAAGANPAETAKQARQPPSGADQAKSAQPQSKGRRPGATVEVRPSVPPGIEERAPDPPPTDPPAAAPPAAAPPALVPFQE